MSTPLDVYVFTVKNDPATHTHLIAIPQSHQQFLRQAAPRIGLGHNGLMMEWKRLFSVPEEDKEQMVCRITIRVANKCQDVYARGPVEKPQENEYMVRETHYERLSSLFPCIMERLEIAQKLMTQVDDTKFNIYGSMGRFIKIDERGLAEDILRDFGALAFAHVKA